MTRFRSFDISSLKVVATVETHCTTETVTAIPHHCGCEKNGRTCSMAATTCRLEHFSVIHISDKRLSYKLVLYCICDIHLNRVT